MPGDDKKKEMKKEADTLQKLMKEVDKKIDRLTKLAGGDMVIASTIKMMDAAMKMQQEQMKQMMKTLK